MSGPDFFRQHITKDQRGLEIGPWIRPMAPKSDGYMCLSLDVFDRATLVERAKADPNIPPAMIDDIEEVDLIGSASALDDLTVERNLTGTLDYVIASHVIEHIPDPVRFLKSVETLLRPGGSLLLAVPDHRACFDYFRPRSTTEDMLAAYEERRVRPTPLQVFSNQACTAEYRGQIAFSLDADAQDVVTRPTLDAAYAAFRIAHASPSEDYIDAHCWVFVPASFELIVQDLIHLGLVSFTLDFISDPIGCEFYVKLVKSANQPSNTEEFYAMRNRLLHKIKRQLMHIEQGSLPAAVKTAVQSVVQPALLKGEIDEVRRSQFFDAAYYLAQNPDVAAAQADPAQHYCQFGWKEGRNPHPAFNSSFYLKRYSDVARAGLNPLLHYIRFGHDEQRVAVPQAPQTAPHLALPQGSSTAFNPLDFYASGAPSVVETAGIFSGEWHSKLPGTSFGRIDLFRDNRIVWGSTVLGGIAGQRVLELGPLEGAHTFLMLKDLGAREVVAVEANSQSYLKCLVVKELYELQNARFLYGDCISYLESHSDRFDFILATGILYHMREPLKLIQQIANHTDRCLIATHYYDEQQMKERPGLAARFSPAGTTSLDQMSYPVWKFDYQEALNTSAFCGGNAPYSFWMDRESILDALRQVGFTTIEIAHEHLSENGPIFTVAASKGIPR